MRFLESDEFGPRLAGVMLLSLVAYVAWKYYLYTQGLHP